MDGHPILAALAAIWGSDVPPWALPLVIFLLRTTDLTLSTMRMMAIVRGRPFVAWVFGFLGASLFVTAIAGVLTDLGGWSLFAYAAGYATGSLVGMMIESRVAPGRSLLRIFTSGPAHGVTEALYAAGRGATRVPASQAGAGEMVLCYVPRREEGSVRRMVATVDPACTITAESVRSLRGGWHV
jgi:uncharacterized protein YebE (UPF0316 family)